MTERNQCDGCAVGAPLNIWDNHQMPDGGRIACTAHLYATPAPAQPDPWHDAVLAECMAIEGAYKSDDPAATLRTLIDWHVMNERSPSRAAAPAEGSAVLEGYLLWDGDDPKGYDERFFCFAEHGDPAHKPGRSDHRKHVWVSKKVYSIGDPSTDLPAAPKEKP